MRFLRILSIHNRLVPGCVEFIVWSRLRGQYPACDTHFCLGRFSCLFGGLFILLHGALVWILLY